jgi:hypothetical protein
MASGDAVTWQYSLPLGGTADVEIWFDLNGNGVAEPGTDKVFARFTQTDGQSVSENGPPDLDGSENGQIYFSSPVGLAPAKYVFKATNGLVGESLAGEVTPLLSPNATISGTVTPPFGAEKKFIVVEASMRQDSSSNGGGDGMFWDALTDSTGFYTIDIHVDTTTTFWQVRVQDNFSPSIPNPEFHIVVLHTSASGIDFTYESAAAKILGTVYDVSHTPVPNIGVSVSSDTGSSFRYTEADGSGHFEIGLLASDLDGRQWRLSTSTSGNVTTGYMQSQRSLGVINSGDSLVHDLTVYAADVQIRGAVTVNGGPFGYQAQINAMSGDSLWSNGIVDSATGGFTVNVSSTVGSYQLNVWPIPFGASGGPFSAAPGDSAVEIAFFLESVIDRGTGVPSAFALRQNYPNPFNPTTSIDYDLPAASYVRLAVFDMLGREVVRLQDGDQRAGSYTAHFDASSLPSGVYFCRLAAANRIATQKMLLMK